MTEDASKAVVKGLKGIMAADSSICSIDGTLGRLFYRGYNIDDLAERGTFEETAYLLLYGELPNRVQVDQFRETLAANSRPPQEVLDLLMAFPRDLHPMAALRTAVSLAGNYDPLAEDESPEANLQKSIRLTSMLTALVAAIKRQRAGEQPLAPKPGLSHAANFMYMLNGREPSAEAERAMDMILILHAEHGFNASTFSGRVICATLTDVYSAITGAIGALKGKLHGGANSEVLKTLQEVGAVANVPGWVESVRARKGKFMGFGHAVYQAEDPRAKHLKDYSRKLGEQLGEPIWYELSVAIEKQVTAVIQRHCNVDFYSASLQHYLGIPGDLFTCVFAASRIAGWCAHVLEQYADNKIIRPSSHYVGPGERAYVPLSGR